MTCPHSLTATSQLTIWRDVPAALPLATADDAIESWMYTTAMVSRQPSIIPRKVRMVLVQGIPVTQVEELKAALARANKTGEFKIYPGAQHGFHADYRPSYRKEAAEDAWAQMRAWLTKYKVLG
ncbi:acetyl esterase/lipase [Nitrobacteraceae bacterium AZCC 1564]